MKQSLKRPTQKPVRKESFPEHVKASAFNYFIGSFSKNMYPKSRHRERHEIF